MSWASWVQATPGKQKAHYSLSYCPSSSLRKGLELPPDSHTHCCRHFYHREFKGPTGPTSELARPPTLPWRRCFWPLLQEKCTSSQETFQPNGPELELVSVCETRSSFPNADREQLAVRKRAKNRCSGTNQVSPSGSFPTVSHCFLHLFSPS